MHKNQPGVVLRFKAKPGKGDELFRLCTDLHHTNDPDAPVDWVLSRDNNDPDVMWAFEFYRDQDSFDRHYSNPVHDEPHMRVLSLLAEEARSTLPCGSTFTSCPPAESQGPFVKVRE